MKNILYEEKISSAKTQALFAALAIIFGLLSFWRAQKTGFDGLAIAALFFSLFFVAYLLNYKTLVIRISDETLKLHFGIFAWTVPFNNIAACELDNNLPFLMKYGGAGIHFMMVDERYRVSFNFLEYDRVIIRLKEKQGWVRDVSFSTKQPDNILEVLSP